MRRADGTELEVRVLRPDRRGPLPAVLWFHGGGQVLGFAAQDDLYLKPLCANVGCVVVSVDYRPAPDYPSPAGAQDGVDAYTWVRKSADAVGVDADRIAEPFC